MLADILWVGGVVLIGFLGFFLVLMVALGRFMRFVMRSVLGMPSESDDGQCRTVRMCTRAGCGNLNPAEALYCARCGQRLGSWADADRYG